jgi:hypothetical protein
MAAVTPAIVRELRRMARREAPIPDIVAGGSVPLDGGVVLSLERLRSVRAFDPLLWRIEVEAGRPPLRWRSSRARAG